MLRLTHGLATESLPRGRRRIFGSMQHVRPAAIREERADRNDRVTLTDAFGHCGSRGGKVLHRSGIRIGAAAIVHGLRPFAQYGSGGSEQIALGVSGRRAADLQRFRRFVDGRDDFGQWRQVEQRRHAAKRAHPAERFLECGTRARCVGVALQAGGHIRRFGGEKSGAGAQRGERSRSRSAVERRGKGVQFARPFCGTMIFGGTPTFGRRE